MSQRPSSSPTPPATSALTRRAVLAATALVPAGAALATGSPALADPSVSGGSTRLVDVTLADVPLVDVEGVPVRELAEQPATMVGVTWPTESTAPDVHVRGLGADGEWTEWFLLETAMNPETGEEASATEAGWVGVVSALQIRAELEDGDVTEGLTAHVVTTSPGPDDAEAARLAEPDATASEETQLRSMSTMTTMSAASAPNPTTPVLGPGAPSFVSRAAWGADESRVGTTYGRDRLKAVIIHHTAGSNSYSSSESAQQVRGIHDYHTRVLGWSDIGYNILVSKYGQVFEGRSGGLQRNIQGAHAYGFNSGSFGISVMGDYSSSAPPRAAQVAVARIVGWKLLSTFQTSVWGQSSWTPGSGTRFTEGKTISLAKMMGHRDVNYTECPGLSLYHRFDSIRGEAQAFIDGGFTDHLRAFEAAGGAASLGTVVEGAHHSGRYLATVLTDGLVLQEEGSARGYATPFGPYWEASWGRPSRTARQDGDRVIQAFENGVAALEDGSVRFQTATFRDVAPERVFFLEIEDLADRGITRGWADGTFRPNNDNLRDAMIVFIHRAMGAPSYTPPRISPFRDVDPSFVFYREICWAYAEGITNGWGSGSNRTFRPLEPVKRDAVAAFLYRAAGEPSASAADSDRFVDVPRDHIFAKEIGWLATTGISRGWDDGTFRPDAYIKRDQMATFVMRWLTQTGRH